MTHSKGRFARDRGLKGSDVFPGGAEIVKVAAKTAPPVDVKPDVRCYNAEIDQDGSAHGHNTSRFTRG